LQPLHERLEIKPEREQEGLATRPKKNRVELARKTMEASLEKGQPASEASSISSFQHMHTHKHTNLKQACYTNSAAFFKLKKPVCM
jgi:hypothetical protein